MSGAMKSLIRLQYPPICPLTRPECTRRMPSTPVFISCSSDGFPRSNVPVASWKAFENNSSTLGARNARAALTATLADLPTGTFNPIDPEPLLNVTVRPGPNFSSPVRDSMRYRSNRPPT
jgi:hypothetical protein